MKQKPSMKEFLEMRKARRANQELVNAKVGQGGEQDPANDGCIAEEKSRNSSVQQVARKKPFNLMDYEQVEGEEDEIASYSAHGDDDEEEENTPHFEHNDDDWEDENTSYFAHYDEDDEESASYSAHDDAADDEEDEEMSYSEDDNEYESMEQIADEDAEEFVRRPAARKAIVPGQGIPYPVHAFGKLADLIMLIARAVQVSPEMIGSSLLGVTSALAQALINVSAKASGTGCPVTVNMFVIACSGERKSTTIAAIAKPLYAAISQAEDSRRHMIIQDVTVDGMVVGLTKRCPSQFLLALEGASLLGGHAMKSENLNRFLAIVSSLYSGDLITRTRVDEHHFVLDRRLSVMLFSQPVVAMDFLSSPMVMQQGLGNRFLYSQPESLLGSRKFDEIELEDQPLYKQYCEKITVLANLPWKINPQTQGVDTRTVRLSPGAKAGWVEFYNSIELAAGPGGDLSTHVEYVTRFPEQVLRLAALLALLEDPNVENISKEIMVRAIELGGYYLQSAMTAFNVAPANKDELDAGTLLKWMRGKIDELNIAAIPVRMMYKDGPRCARPIRRTKELLALLESRGEVAECTKTVVYGDNKRSAENYTVIGM